MVELLKGPDKGKLGIIKMIVQVVQDILVKTSHTVLFFTLLIDCRKPLA